MLDAYSDLLQKLEEKREAELKPEKKAEEQKIKRAVEKADTLSLDGVTRGIGDLKSELNKTFADLLEKLETELPENTGKIISGGPMMGKAVSSLDIPVTKGTSGILIMESSESERAKIMNCIRCSKCVSVCPMGLEPFLLEKLAAKGGPLHGLI